MTPAVIGGILLIFGSYFVYTGKIFKSIGVFVGADICWIFVAISVGDIFGAITVTIGMILGILAFLKIHKGDMRKSLDL